MPDQEQFQREAHDLKEETARKWEAFAAKHGVHVKMDHETGKGINISIKEPPRPKLQYNVKAGVTRPLSAK
jgi:hypothetical protein